MLSVGGLGLRGRDAKGKSIEVQELVKQINLSFQRVEGELGTEIKSIFLYVDRFVANAFQS